VAATPKATIRQSQAPHCCCRGRALRAYGRDPAFGSELGGNCPFGYFSNILNVPKWLEHSCDISMYRPSWSYLRRLLGLWSWSFLGLLRWNWEVGSLIFVRIYPGGLVHWDRYWDLSLGTRNLGLRIYDLIDFLHESSDNYQILLWSARFQCSWSVGSMNQWFMEAIWRDSRLWGNNMLSGFFVALEVTRRQILFDN
jgi:hypothetical protein